MQFLDAGSVISHLAQQITSAACFSMLFSCPAISFVIPSALPLSFQNIVSPLLPDSFH
jgi:hypothetical protein